MFWDYDEIPDAVWVTASRNEDRADWAEAAVREYRSVCRGDNDLSAIYDLIADLGHLYDRLAATHNLGVDMLVKAGKLRSFDDILRLAQLHYDCEKGEGEGDDIEQAIHRNDEGDD